ncbi:potassium channel family protein [Agromyces aerolatus]|uniref:potassium channel family protein n=1 Tax=Agromyces sp. LY-1074 TaxID=3074080 RepID=UPI002861A5AF|nr:MULTISPECIES: ion channel [unclassified Agromyces]MDR5701829.1 ion channel [Agromyces sp. LY-1074]MDR5707501.1 ion channel [Agromyces sp. LY-1358]
MSAGPALPAPRRDAWERVTAVPLAALGLAFIVAYSIFVLAVDVDSAWHTPLVVILLTSWIVFLTDVLVRIALTPRGGRWRFVFTHPIDVLSGLIPLFRALRVLELLNQIPYLRRRTGGAVRAQFIVFATSYALAFIYFLALATLQAERNAPGANILTFGDAIWWAFVTIATVGYGDEYPITAAGRFYAVLLMIGGVAIVGTASATIISVLNERIARLRHHGGHDTSAERAADETFPARPGLDSDVLAEPRPQPPVDPPDRRSDG